MLSIKNDELTVSVLDPNRDYQYFGTRYSTGGHIFQIHNKRHGDLLSGPTFPESYNSYDGQGIPDSFHMKPLLFDVKNEREALILGIGHCDLKDDKVLEFAPWTVREDETSISMEVEHSHGSYHCSLYRRLILQGRSLKSEIRIENHGDIVLPVVWFPHPFFPQPDSDQLFKISGDLEFEQGKGYEIDSSGFISRLNWEEGKDYYLPVLHTLGEKSLIVQRHKDLNFVAAEIGYTPGYFPIWGNNRTFSWEPFYERNLEPFNNATWRISYHF